MVGGKQKQTNKHQPGGGMAGSCALSKVYHLSLVVVDRIDVRTAYSMQTLNPPVPKHAQKPHEAEAEKMPSPSGSSHITYRTRPPTNRGDRQGCCTPYSCVRCVGGEAFSPLDAPELGAKV